MKMMIMMGCKSERYRCTCGSHRQSLTVSIPGWDASPSQDNPQLEMGGGGGNSRLKVMGRCERSQTSGTVQIEMLC